MSEITKTVGQRLRNYRTQAGLSQEKLAELASCHPTYIGQVERGEKNATMENVAKIAKALNVPLDKLFAKLGGNDDGTRNIPAECYELIAAQSIPEQERLHNLLSEIIAYKNN